MIRCTLLFGRERRDTFCTQIGPAAGFLACRTKGLQVGMAVSLEMRPGGVGTPAMVLLAEVVRLVLHGSPWPNGAATRWKTASCELGIAPLLDFLVQSLKVPGVSHTDIAAGRATEFDLEGYVAGHPARVRAPARTSDVMTVERFNAAPARRTGHLSRVIPTGGLLSALAPGMGSSGRSVGHAPMSAGWAVGHAAELAPMPPLMLRGDAHPIDRVGGARRHPQVSISVSPAHHTGGPAPESAPLATAAAAHGELANANRTHTEAYVALHAGPQAPATLHAAIGLPAGLSTGSLTPAGSPVVTAAPVMAQRPPFAAAPGSGFFGAPSHAGRGGAPHHTGEAMPEPVLPPPRQPEAASLHEPPSSAFGWRDAAAEAALVGDSDRAAKGPAASVGPKVHRPVTPPPVVDSRHLFGGNDEEISHAVAHARVDPPTNIPLDGLSQSWPVYALAPGERREATEPEGPQIPALIAAGKSFDLPGEPTETRPRDPVTDEIGQEPAAVPEMAVMRRRRPQDNVARPMVAATVPVTYDHQGKMGRGVVVAVSAQVVAVVTNDSAPNLDDAVVLHMPIRDRSGPVTVHLCGKLLQVCTETEQGPRFVLHIERVEEGLTKGAFVRLLDQLAGA